MRVFLFVQTEKEVPGRGKANVVVAVVIVPIVDIETIRVELAEVDAVAVGIQIFVRFHLCHQKLNLFI